MRALLALALAAGGAAGSGPLHQPGVALLPSARTAWAAGVQTGVRLAVNDTRPARSGTWVAVTWNTTGALPASPLDVVAYYVPASACTAAGCGSKAPVKFANVTLSRPGAVAGTA
jgi:hypothetical protein